MYQVMIAAPLSDSRMHAEVDTLEEAREIADELADDFPGHAVEILKDWAPLDA